MIAPKTGGLIDFFDDWHGVGFPYEPYHPKQNTDQGFHRQRLNSLITAIGAATAIYWNDRPRWDRDFVFKATEYNSSWDSRIEQYERDVYEPALVRVRGAGPSAAEDFEVNINGQTRKLRMELLDPSSLSADELNRLKEQIVKELPSTGSEEQVIEQVVSKAPNVPATTGGRSPG